MPTPYARPEPTNEEKSKVVAFVAKRIRDKSTVDLRLFIVALAVENIRLTAECNDHRAARGFEPLPTFEVP